MTRHRAQMGTFCEMAWNQGDDLYGYDGDRFMKGAQYVAKYNTGRKTCRSRRHCA